jgi:hypothetical protein
MIRDERWPIARLIPVTTASGVEAKERCSASALLAVMTAVEEFGRALLRPLGAPAGKIEAFVETPFKVGTSTIRPDGVIAVTRGGRSWQALVEVKTGPNEIETKQLETYLELAREHEFDAVLTISNQYVTKSSDYPYVVDRKKLKRVHLHHWSWFRVLTEAEVQKRHRGVKDPDQAYILGELIRYLTDARSGIVMFGDMGPAWTAVREGARVRTLRRSDPNVAALAMRWDELVRFLALDLTRELGRDVTQVVSRAEAVPGARAQALRESLASSGKLHAELHIPDTAGPLELTVDLATRQVSVATRIDAPRDGRSRGRISWLLRQLGKSPPQLIVEAKVARTPTSISGLLGPVRENPDLLLPDKDKEIRQFVLTLTRDMGMNRAAGRGGFIDSVTDATKAFYKDVLQNLTAWKAKPPKLLADRQPAPVSEELPSEIASAVEDAQEEAESATSIAVGSDSE